MRKSETTTAITLRGQIDTVFYSSTTFSAGRLLTADRREVSFAGKIYVQQGEQVVFRGKWTKHPKYGRQFSVETMEYNLDLDKDGLANFLANHPDIKGIGQAKAKLIAERFNGTFEKVLKEEPLRIAEVAKVPVNIIEDLRSIWLHTRETNHVMAWLSAFGLTHHQVTTLVKKLGNNTMSVLKADPYLLIREVKGFGFKKVDVIARKMGTSKDRPERIRAGIVHCVYEALDQGHCWTGYEDLVKQANLLLIMDTLDSRDRIEKALDNLIEDKILACISQDGRFLIALPDINMMERELAQTFSSASLQHPHSEKLDDIPSLIEKHANTLNDGQREAVLNSLGHRISLLSGGAGSGKTYTVASVVRICEAAKLQVMLAAPTGKAAKRLEEVVGCSAQTIHRMLGYNGKTFERDQTYPIRTDVLVVDECFDYRQRILTERGWEHIGKVVNQREQIRVWSRNPKSSQLELKPIIRWLKHIAPEELIHITASRTQSMRNARSIRCTAEHRILTPYGYRKACELRQDEEIIVRGADFTPEQRSILVGSLLGDGCMGRNKTDSPQVTLVQGDAQKSYLDFKQTAFGSLACEVRQGESGYTDNTVWRMGLKTTDETHRIAKEMIILGKHSSGRRRWVPTDRFIEWIDEQALAIWYLDNGSLDSRKLSSGEISYYASIHTQRFRKSDNQRFSDHLDKKFGLAPTVAPDSKGNWFLRFNKVDTDKLLDIISPYVPGCMEYKSPYGSGYSYSPEFDSQTSTAYIQNIEHCNPSSRYVFDIEVADNHNYIAGNIVVSNCSMVDVTLAWHLFQAIDLSKTAVLLVGDHNQLPPVGPGNLLRDLVQTKAIPTVILDKVVRQAGVLKENSTAILQGEVRKTSVPEPDGKRRWFLVDQFGDVLQAQDFLTQLYEEVLQERLGYDLIRDVQVLTPTHKGPLGTRVLNEILQRLVQRKLWNIDVPPTPPVRRLKFLTHDKVIQTRNNYEIDVMNGAMGFIRNVERDGSMSVEFDGRVIPLQAGSPGLRYLQLGYSLTTHKAQGSEYPCVIVIMHKAHSFMHHRNLFYTGVTRAKRTAIIIGDHWGVRNCAQKRQVDSRRTFLSLLLKPLCVEAV